MITGLGSAKDLVSGKKGAFYNTLEEFHKYWDRIDIIAPRVRGYKPDAMCLFGNVYIHVSPWPLVFHPLWFLKKGLEIYRQQKFDLMTVHEFPPFYNGIGARLLWQKIKVPYVLEIFHIPGYPKSATIKEEIYKQLMKIFAVYDAAKARGIRIMNNQVGGFLKEFGVPPDKINLIPAIYVDLETFKPINLQKKYDLIFVGRLEKNKGIDLLLEAAKNLTVKNPNLKILIVGAGLMGEGLKSEVKTLKLENNIMFHGWAKDSREIAELLNKSRLLIMPSYNEGGPRVVVEAMACGVPALATPVGIVPDLLKNGLGGEIIGWNAEDIARKAAGFLSDFGRYSKASAEAVEMAKSFDKKAAIKNYADKLKELI